MSKTTIEQTLKLIPSLFEINLNNDKSGTIIFEKLPQILDFDEAFIYFLNPESLQLKYSFKEHKNYKANSIFEMSTELKKQMFSKEGKLLSPDCNFIKTVGLAELKKKSYILAKISVKSTVFGIILLAKKEHNFYSEEDYQERLNEWLKENPGWVKTSYGTLTNEIENEHFKKMIEGEK